MSFKEDSRVQAAIALLKSATKVNVAEADFVEFLESTTAGALGALRHIAFERFVEIFKMPDPLARAICEELREKKKVVSSQRDQHFKARNASECSPEELVEEVAKKPLQSNSRYFKSLRTLVHDAAVMVWVDGEIDQVETVKRVNLATSQQKLKPFVNVNGKPVVALKLGIPPDSQLQEHPVFKGDFLDVEGFGEDGFNWGSLPYTRKLLLALLVAEEVFTFRKDNLIDLSSLFKLAESGALETAYPDYYLDVINLLSQQKVHIFTKSKSTTNKKSLQGAFS